MDFHRGGDTSSIFEDLYSCMIIMIQFRPDFLLFVFLLMRNIVVNNSVYLQDEKYYCVSSQRGRYNNVLENI